MQKQMIFPFILLAAVPFVMVLGNSMLIPVFPKMEAVMDLTPFKVGLIITAFSLPAGIMIPFAGFLSDRIGRKKIITPALVLFGLGGLIAGIAAIIFTRPFIPIIVGRVVQGLGAGGTYQMAMALTGDIFQSQERTKALGLLESANGLGKVISPILGSLTALIAWYIPFFVYGLLSFPVALGVWFVVKEPQNQPGGKSLPQYFQTLRQIINRKGLSLAIAFLIGFVALFVLFGVLSYLSDVLEQKYGLTGVIKGLALSGPVFAMSVASYAVGAFLENRSQWLKAALVVGMSLVAAALVLPTLNRAIRLFYAEMILMGIGIGMVLPPLNTLITGAADTDERGIITAVYGTVRFFGVAAGPATCGLLVTCGTSVMFLTAAAATGLVAVLTFLLMDTAQMLRQENQAPQPA